MNYIFYHLYYYVDGFERFKKTLEKIKASKLYENTEKIYINVVGTTLTDEHPVVQYCKNDTKLEYYNIMKHNEYVSAGESELETLQLLWDTAQQLQNNDKILYLHSKGVSHNKNKNIEAWIDVMEYFLIETWQDATEKLQEYNTCGVNIRGGPIAENLNHFHYSGNFWWAQAAYIKQTRKPGVDYWIGNRVWCELWIIDPRNVPNHSKTFYCMHDSKVDHYTVFYDRSNYAK